jgi:hypothetical protein
LPADGRVVRPHGTDIGGGKDPARRARDRLSTFIIEVNGRLSTTTNRSGAL